MTPAVTKNMVMDVKKKYPTVVPRHLKHGFFDDPCKQGQIPILTNNLEINDNIMAPMMILTISMPISAPIATFREIAFSINTNGTLQEISTRNNWKPRQP